MSAKERPKFEVCKKRTKRHRLALPHVLGPDRRCVECKVDPVLAAAAYDCRCRLNPSRVEAETCACGIDWYHQENGPTRATRLGR